jgi:catechol 2,3-dioxygenase-like lactoylglutathione lyase family enzyme
MKWLFVALFIYPFGSTTTDGAFLQDTEGGKKLGNATQITIGTADVAVSVEFYKKLGFKLLAEDVNPNPWAQLTDGTLLLMLNQDGQEYMGLTYFSGQMEKRVKELESDGIEMYHSVKQEGRFFQGMFPSLNGILVSLINYDYSGMFQPEGIELMDLKPEEMSDPEKFPNRRIGIFGEFSIPVKDLNKSLEYWKGLGFESKSINESPYPWAIVTDGMNTLGLHETSDFEKPAITYFAPDMAGRIKKLKESGVVGFKLFGDDGNEGNQVLSTPEGQQFFLFTM